MLFGAPPGLNSQVLPVIWKHLYLPVTDRHLGKKKRFFPKQNRMTSGTQTVLLRTICPSEEWVVINLSSLYPRVGPDKSTESSKEIVGVICGDFASFQLF